MKKYYFTFGFDHWYKEIGLANMYFVIEAEDSDVARIEMFKIFDNKWAMQYSEKEGLRIIEKWNLQEFTL